MSQLGCLFRVVTCVWGGGGGGGGESADPQKTAIRYSH